MIKEKILKAINEKVAKHGIMGSEAVNVTMELTNEEKEEFLESDISTSPNYSWDIDGNILSISYYEEI